MEKHMKKALVFLTAAAVLTTLTACKKEKPMNKADVVFENILSRKSVRSYTNQKVSRDDLMKIVKAGMAAPTAINIQPWEFIVIDDPNILAELGGVNRAGQMIAKAPAAIVVAGNMDAYKDRPNARDFWVQDTSAATENILLQIEAMGLGAVWTAAFPVQERMDGIRKVLNLPDNIIPLNVIAVGYPDTENKPKDKWKENKLHWNAY